MYVESYDEVFRMFIFQDLEKQFDKTKDPVGGKSVFCREDGHGIIGAV